MNDATPTITTPPVATTTPPAATITPQAATNVSQAATIAPTAATITPPTAISAPQAAALLPLETLLSAIGTPTRWRILARLSDNLGYAIGDVARAVGVSYATAYTHLELLNEIGIIRLDRGRLWRIYPLYQPDPAQRVLEFGHCTLRFDAANKTT